jgi:GT2 family glycosyltransferase
MRFSIIIPTFKRQDALSLCLNSLECYFQPGVQKRLGHQVEVIVTDDAREATLHALLELQYPWCYYVEGPQRGPSANRNYGAQNASGDWLVFTDDDCLPQPGWIEAYAALADQVDLLEGRTSPAGIRTRLDEECPINETGGYLWSCNFAIRRKTFLALGGFNEDFPAAAMEDVEFNLRANKAGLARAFVADAVVLHPWRLRKDRSFVEAYSRSVAKFVHLHPETAARFSLTQQLLNLARSFKRNMFQSISSGQRSGLARQLYLDTCSCFLAWNAVRRDRLG